MRIYIVQLDMITYSLRIQLSLDELIFFSISIYYKNKTFIDSYPWVCMLYKLHHRQQALLQESECIPLWSDTINLTEYIPPWSDTINLTECIPPWSDTSKVEIRLGIYLRRMIIGRTFHDFPIPNVSYHITNQSNRWS